MDLRPGEHAAPLRRNCVPVKRDVEACTHRGSAREVRGPILERRTPSNGTGSSVISDVDTQHVALNWSSRQVGGEGRDRLRKPGDVGNVGDICVDGRSSRLCDSGRTTSDPLVRQRRGSVDG